MASGIPMASGPGRVVSRKVTRYCYGYSYGTLKYYSSLLEAHPRWDHICSSSRLLSLGHLSLGHLSEGDLSLASSRVAKHYSVFFGARPR